MNPILPPDCFVPDVEARQWSDGRMYLYGSLDIDGDSFYCSRQYRVFSSADLETWTDHGLSFDAARAHSTPDRLFAPDCICKDNRYYLLYCGNDNSEGLAASDSPTGPFEPGKPIDGADSDGIDPAALVDDDGTVYYFWGQFELRGAALTPDLTAVDRTTFTPKILTEDAHGFHEGACIRKRNGLYYLVYTDISRGRATCLAYATSPAPLGPYEKRGVIIDNTGCDPESWNNHGSIAEFNGQWYVFYHRSSQASHYNRRVCIEPIRFNEDGTIDEVEMTSQGVSGPLEATQPIDAFRVCGLSGKVRSQSIPRRSPDEPAAECLANIHDWDFAVWKYAAFPEGLTTFRATVASLRGEGYMEVRLDNRHSPLLATVEIPDTGGWRIWREVEAELQLPAAAGAHAVYLVFRGPSGRLMDLRRFAFA